MREIIQHPTHISITDYTLGECRRVERAFTYAENKWTITPVGIVYDEDTKELRIFGGANIKYIQYITGLPYRNDYTIDPYAKISIHLKGDPRSKLQKDMIHFLVGTGDYEANKNEPQLSCNAETGEGKTFCAIAMMTYMNVKTIIIVNRDNIRKNWVREVLNFTDLDERRLLILDKGSLLDGILNDKIDTQKYEVFVVVHRLLGNYGRTNGWDQVGVLFQKLQIGLKIYDEAHMEFLNTTFIDAYTNTYKTLYLTATPKLSNPKANYIYQNVFKMIPRFDQRSLGYTDSKKHIHMLLIRYNSHPSLDWISRCYNHRLKYFSAREHSIYQIQDDPYFFPILSELMEKMVVKNGFRSLILVSRIVACNEIAKFIRENFHLDAASYHSQVSQQDKQRALKEAKVIVSTNQSLGLSETIPELQFVLNAEAHRNFGDQASGRLRRLDGDRMCIYCEFVDAGFRSIVKQWNDRKRHYSVIFSEIIELNKEKM